MHIQTRKPFNVRPVVREHQINAQGVDLRATHRTAACSYLYITRQDGSDELGTTPAWSQRKDLVATGRIAPIRGDVPEREGIRLWQQADKQSRESRPSAATAMHLVGSLPPALDPDAWQNMAQEFGEEMLMRRGMIVDWAIHALRAEGEEWQIHPHMHMLVTTRGWNPDRAPGVRRQTWLGSKAQIVAAGNAWFEISGIYPQGSYVYDDVVV